MKYRLGMVGVVLAFLVVVLPAFFAVIDVASDMLSDEGSPATLAWILTVGLVGGFAVLFVLWWAALCMVRSWKKSDVPPAPGGNNMGRAAVLVALLVSALGCTRVPPGYEGIKVYMWGEGRAEQDVVTVQGRVTYNPMTQDVIITPVFVQRYTWCEEHALTFNSMEGTMLGACFAVAVQLQPGKSRDLFWTYRRELPDWVDTVFRDAVRDELNHVGGEMPVMEIMGPGKAKMLNEVVKRVHARFPDLIRAPSISMTGQVKVPSEVSASINQVIEARNQAEKERQKIAVVEAKAHQAVAEAQGQLDAAILQAQANEVLARSITPTLVEYKALDRWDGKVPQVTAGAVPFINISGK